MKKIKLETACFLYNQKRQFFSCEKKVKTLSTAFSCIPLSITRQHISGVRLWSGDKVSICNSHLAGHIGIPSSMTEKSQMSMV
ncbi:MAG: hypothetical protein ACLUQK_17380 [Clostridium sp.]|uniref:hypothetical protein n=1 Tax=Clostridium innocuum TaxID=1522 RepID=UPI001AF9BD6B|nr:hypothetical protein [[Clostridium] innocuum]MCC2833288.1 hypothetical protein [[Clostridium] innocuum]MCR0502309.1 hypothetical protein [[Clostridium] innocuum]QSI25185.1 hypothetical protein GKZ87_06640 [Erysipelotrichaceae bacterium 66202529]